MAGEPGHEAKCCPEQQVLLPYKGPSEDQPEALPGARALELFYSEGLQLLMGYRSNAWLLELSKCGFNNHLALLLYAITIPLHRNKIHI